MAYRVIGVFVALALALSWLLGLVMIARTAQRTQKSYKKRRLRRAAAIAPILILGLSALDWQSFIAKASAVPLTTAQPQPAQLGPPMVGFTPQRSEPVGAGELMQLAGKLARKKDETSQRLGRALMHAVRGEPFAEHGFRHNTALELTREIIHEYPYCDPFNVAEHLRAAVNRLEDLGSKLTTEALANMLADYQGKHQAKKRATEALKATALGRGLTASANTAPIVGEIGAQVGGTCLPQSVAAVAGASEVQALAPDYRTIIVHANGCFYLRHPLGSEYSMRLTNKDSLRIELKNQFGLNNETLILSDDAGAMLKTEDLFLMYAANAHTIVTDYAARATLFDADTATLRIGFDLPLRLAALGEPCVDAEVEAWLLEFSGGKDENLCELYDWLAGTGQQYSSQPGAAAAFVGKRDTGKSLFANALAGTWGAPFVPLAAAVDKFNAVIAQCPIWFADEHMPDEITDSIFRELVQADGRFWEPKGKEREILKGCSRIVIAVNEVEDLAIQGASGPDAVEAIADRLSIFYPTPHSKAALEPLRLGNYRVDIARVVNHMRWLQANIMPRRQRFLGARPNLREAQAPVLAAIVAREPELFEMLASYLSDPLSWEREYNSAPSGFGAPGRKFPLVTQSGKLFAYPSALAERLGQRQLYRIQRGLAPFCTGPRYELSFGRFKTRYWQLDVDNLFTALGIDPLPALVADTRDRMLSAGVGRALAT